MVNLGNILNSAQTMGPVFWAGAAAMALGATLLIMSILTMLRRIKYPSPQMKIPNFGKKAHRNASASTAGTAAPSATVRKTVSGYEPTAFPLNTQETQAEAAPSMVSSDLTERLHRAANTLEEIIHGLQKENYSSGFSSLKDDHEDVEYLFKTTVG